jgi:hypothetical protein
MDGSTQLRHADAQDCRAKDAMKAYEISRQKLRRRLRF